MSKQLYYIEKYTYILCGYNTKIPVIRCYRNMIILVYRDYETICNMIILVYRDYETIWNKF